MERLIDVLDSRAALSGIQQLSRIYGRDTVMLADHAGVLRKGFRIVWRRVKNGAAYVTRTRDPIITNDVLYQLS